MRQWIILEDGKAVFGCNKKEYCEEKMRRLQEMRPWSVFTMVEKSNQKK